MILSVSRRTDIPAFYSEWFINRLKEGFLYVRNPMNPRQISRIELSPRTVDCIVFWTKNPANMLGRMEELRDYAYYIQFTLTGYGGDMEPGLPDKRETLIPLFKELSGRIGRHRVIWRYDPVLLSDRYTAEYHLRAFAQIAESLAPYTERAVISFVDLYAKTKRNTRGLGVRAPGREEMLYLAGEMARISAERGLDIVSCAEQADLQGVGVRHGSCIDRALIERILGCRLSGGKDRNQRRECGCLESVEVGAYHTCLNGCKYCYANFSDIRAREGAALYDAASPLLCGSVGPEDKVTERKARTLRREQLSLFE